MKRKEFLKEINGMSGADLQGRAKEIAHELMKLRFRQKTGQLEKSHRIRGLKRELARVQTVISKQRQAETKTSAGKAS